MFNLFLRRFLTLTLYLVSLVNYFIPCLLVAFVYHYRKPIYHLFFGKSNF